MVVEAGVSFLNPLVRLSPQGILIRDHLLSPSASYCFLHDSPPVVSVSNVHLEAPGAELTR